VEPIYLYRFSFLNSLEVFYRYKQVELLIIENDMFIGTVLKSLEIEDLVCCNRVSRPCFLARSFIGSADANSSLYDGGDQNFDGNDVTPSEGDDSFYEAPENLIDSVDYPIQSPRNKSEHAGSQNLHRSEILSLKPPSFSRIAGLLPTDAFQTRRQDIELTDTLDSFVKAQIIIYHQNSPRYSNIDNQVGIFCV
jgi:vacuolar protein sorting-associated protein 13A/C